MLVVRVYTAACRQVAAQQQQILWKGSVRGISASTQRQLSKLHIYNPQKTSTRNYFKLREKYEQFAMRSDKTAGKEILVYSNGLYTYMIGGYIMGGAVSLWFLVKTIKHLSETDMSHRKAFGATWFDRMSDWWNDLSPSSSLAWYLNGVVYGLVICTICRAMMSRGFARMYMNPETEEFRAIAQNFMLRRKVSTFTCKQVKPKAPGQVLREMAGNYYVKGRPYMIQHKDFSSPKYYAIFRGAYDDSWR